MPKATRADSLEKSGYVKFWVVALSNGNTSIPLDSVSDCFDWIMEHVDEKLISGILINRKWRRNYEKSSRTRVKKSKGSLVSKAIQKAVGKSNVHEAR